MNAFQRKAIGKTTIVKQVGFTGITCCPREENTLWATVGCLSQGHEEESIIEFWLWVGDMGKVALD